MNKTLIEILKSREDISEYVFHFTKNRNAKDILKKILSDGAIKDVIGNGYICFTEAPITMLPSMFHIFKQYDDPMFAPYGIGIKRNTFYEMGGRPVIYGNNDDRKILPSELLWRFVPLYPESYDFSWLREWRIPTSEMSLTYENSFVIIDAAKDLDDMLDYFFDLDDIDIDSQPEDGGVLTEYTGFFSRKFKVITMEEIEEVNNMSKQQLEVILNKQDEQYGRFLGSTWN